MHVLTQITAKDYMAANLVTFKPDQDVMSAIHQLLENGISGAPVLDNTGNIVGLLSEKDCLKVAMSAGYHNQYSGNVADFMTTSVITVEADTSIVEVAKMFLNTPYKRFPVVQENRLIGQISRRDVLRAIRAISKS
ncbi:MAG: CBS domain-containing protein [Oceanococcaceae bacterium]